MVAVSPSKRDLLCVFVIEDTKNTASTFDIMFNKFAIPIIKQLHFPSSVISGNNNKVTVNVKLGRVLYQEGRENSFSRPIFPVLYDNFRDFQKDIEAIKFEKDVNSDAGFLEGIVGAIELFDRAAPLKFDKPGCEHIRHLVLIGSSSPYLGNITMNNSPKYNGFDQSKIFARLKELKVNFSVISPLYDNAMSLHKYVPLINSSETKVFRYEEKDDPCCAGKIAGIIPPPNFDPLKNLDIYFIQDKRAPSPQPNQFLNVVKVIKTEHQTESLPKNSKPTNDPTPIKIEPALTEPSFPKSADPIIGNNIKNKTELTNINNPAKAELSPSTLNLPKTAPSQSNPPEPLLDSSKISNPNTSSELQPHQQPTEPTNQTSTEKPAVVVSEISHPPSSTIHQSQPATPTVLPQTANSAAPVPMNRKNSSKGSRGGSKANKKPSVARKQSKSQVSKSVKKGKDSNTSIIPGNNVMSPDPIMSASAISQPSNPNNSTSGPFNNFPNIPTNATPVAMNNGPASMNRSVTNPSPGGFNSMHTPINHNMTPNSFGVAHGTPGMYMTPVNMNPSMTPNSMNPNMTPKGNYVSLPSNMTPQASHTNITQHINQGNISQNMNPQSNQNNMLRNTTSQVNHGNMSQNMIPHANQGSMAQGVNLQSNHTNLPINYAQFFQNGQFQGFNQQMDGFNMVNMNMNNGFTGSQLNNQVFSQANQTFNNQDAGQLLNQTFNNQAQMPNQNFNNQNQSQIPNQVYGQNAINNFNQLSVQTPQQMTNSNAQALNNQNPITNTNGMHNNLPGDENQIRIGNQAVSNQNQTPNIQLLQAQALAQSQKGNMKSGNQANFQHSVNGNGQMIPNHSNQNNMIMQNNGQRPNNNQLSNQSIPQNSLVENVQHNNTSNIQAAQNQQGFQRNNNIQTQNQNNTQNLNINSGANNIGNNQALNQNQMINQSNFVNAMNTDATNMSQNPHMANQQVVNNSHNSAHVNLQTGQNLNNVPQHGNIRMANNQPTSAMNNGMNQVASNTISNQMQVNPQQMNAQANLQNQNNMQPSNQNNNTMHTQLNQNNQNSFAQQTQNGVNTSNMQIQPTTARLWSGQFGFRTFNANNQPIEQTCAVYAATTPTNNQNLDAFSLSKWPEKLFINAIQPCNTQLLVEYCNKLKIPSFTIIGNPNDPNFQLYKNIYNKLAETKGIAIVSIFDPNSQTKGRNGLVFFSHNQRIIGFSFMNSPIPDVNTLEQLVKGMIQPGVNTNVANIQPPAQQPVQHMTPAQPVTMNNMGANLNFRQVMDPNGANQQALMQQRATAFALSQQGIGRSAGQMTQNVMNPNLNHMNPPVAANISQLNAQNMNQLNVNNINQNSNNNQMNSVNMNQPNVGNIGQMNNTNNMGQMNAANLAQLNMMNPNSLAQMAAMAQANKGMMAMNPNFAQQLALMSGMNPNVLQNMGYPNNGMINNEMLRQVQNNKAALLAQQMQQQNVLGNNQANVKQLQNQVQMRQNMNNRGNPRPQ